MPRQYLRKLFRELISGIQKESQAKKINKKFPLVLDKCTKRVVAGLFTTNEIISMGIMVPENLEIARQPLDENAIYFIEPTEESVNLLLKDFSVKHQYQYFCVNVVFSGELPQKLMELISTQEHLVKRIVTFQEFHINLVFLSENVCSLEIPQALELTLTHEKVEKMAKNIFILVTSLECRSTYEIHYTNNSLCEGICNTLVDLLKSNPNKSAKALEPVVVVILDRMTDPVSPLVRSLIYNPMLRDLKKLQQNYVIITKQKSKSIFYLDSSDSVLSKYRNKHFADVSELLPKEVKQYRENSSASKFQSGDSTELRSISEITEYNKKTLLYNFHLKMVEELIDVYKAKSILRINDLENMIVSGLTNEGGEQSQKAIFVQCFDFLSEMKDEEDRMRVMLLMLMCMELPKDKAAIIKEVSSHFQKDISKVLSVLCPKITKLKEKRIKENNFVCRHTPKIVEVWSNIDSKKDNAGFKTIKISTTAQKPTAMSKISQNVKKDSTNTVVFMAGPIGWNEISYVERLGSKSKPYFLGSKVCTPNQYMGELLKMCNKEMLL